MCRLVLHELGKFLLPTPSKREQMHMRVRWEGIPVRYLRTRTCTPREDTCCVPARRPIRRETTEGCGWRVLCKAISYFFHLQRTRSEKSAPPCRQVRQQI